MFVLVSVLLSDVSTVVKSVAPLSNDGANLLTGCTVSIGTFL